jgi:hypothetical protein
VAQKSDISHAPSGLTQRRAASTLFAIQGRSARRASEIRLAVSPYLPDQLAEARQGAFLQAFEQGRDLPVQPTIQEIERCHAEWASLAPADGEVSAVLAHLLGEKYRFTAGDVLHIRAALGLDRPAVQQAFERLYGQPFSTIYTFRLTPADRLRWLWGRLSARLENLSPFWIAYSLTLAAMLGPAALALPVVMAGVGPLIGVMILLVAGLASLLTILALGEAAARNGHVRFGQASGGFGRLAADYLGRGGALLSGLALSGLTVMLLLACYIGLSTTLSGATGLPPLVFAAALLVVNLYFLRSEPAGPGLAVVWIIGAANLVLLLALSGLALGRPAFSLADFNLAGPVAGRPFNASALTLVLGVVLAAYFGHASVSGAARLALKRHPSGRALLGGLAAAVLTAMLVYCLWVLAVDGALGPANLSSLQISSGTIVTALARQAGAPAGLLGSLYAVLALGFGSLQFSQALSSQVSWWLPRPAARLGSSRRGRFWSGVIPAGLIFIYVAWQLASRRASFSGLFWFAAVALPLLAGIFPMLTLVAARRKSDLLPDRGVGWLGKRPAVWCVCLFYLAGMFLYGVWVWKTPFEQALILLAALLATGLAFLLWRQGAFTPRLVVHLRLDKTPGERLSFSINADGKPLAVRVVMQYRFEADEPVLAAVEGQIERFTELHRISFDLPTSPAGPGEIKVWTQQPMPDGSTGPLPAWLIIGEKEWDLNKWGGEVITRLEGGVGVVTVLFQ